MFFYFQHRWPAVNRDASPVTSPEAPAYSAPNVGPLFAMWDRSIVLALPIVQPDIAVGSPVPDCVAPKVTPVLITLPRSIVLLDPAMSCDMAPELLSCCSLFDRVGGIAIKYVGGGGGGLMSIRLCIRCIPFTSLLPVLFARGHGVRDVLLNLPGGEKQEKEQFRR